MRQDSHELWGALVSMKLLDFEVGNDRPIFLIAGPCVIETQEVTLRTAQALKEMTGRLRIPFIFKSSFDKANRKSGKAYRGPGMEKGLRILELVKKEVGVPVITDVHEDTPVNEVASVVDIVQTPAFLVRQTSFLERVARAGKPIHVKRGQFMAPWDLQDVVTKLRDFGNHQIMLCERGACFGYDSMVSDMRALEVMKQTGCPVVFDATHSVQQPGGFGPTGMQRALVPPLARAATAVGIAGLFLETHPDPDKALSDGPNMWPLDKMEELLGVLLEIDGVVKKQR
jgi:2-dehydro-3-deoxyphosphooctonate aldolase (KDO 8-P synthase)